MRTLPAAVVFRHVMKRLYSNPHAFKHLTANGEMRRGGP